MKGFDILNSVLKEMQECSAGLQERVEALEAKQAPAECEPAVDTSWPQKGDTYFAVNKIGFVCQETWFNDSDDLSLLARGNAFHTREEAEKVDQLRLAMNQLQVMASSASRHLRGNYYAVYDAELSKWYTIFGRHLIVPGAVFFPTDASAMAAIEFVDEKYPGVLR